MTRYPNLRVSQRSANPMALVAAVRLELRRAGIDPDEIDRFSEQALVGGDAQRTRKVCEEWVQTEAGRAR
jgi:hypothetical protein